MINHSTAWKSQIRCKCLNVYLKLSRSVCFFITLNILQIYVCIFKLLLIYANSELLILHWAFMKKYIWMVLFPCFFNMQLTLHIIKRKKSLQITYTGNFSITTSCLSQMKQVPSLHKCFKKIRVCHRFVIQFSYKSHGKIVGQSYHYLISKNYS